MSYTTLAEFVEQLETDGQLARVTAEVDAELEITEITRRIAEKSRAAVLFELVAGSRLSVVTNLLGSNDRICRALGVETLEEIVHRVGALLAPSPQGGWLDALRRLPQSSASPVASPKMAKNGPCQQVVKLGGDVRLGELPALRCWPGETARTITAGAFFSRDPETHIRNVGLYPLTILDDQRLLVVWEPHQGGAAHLDKYRRDGRQMPVAVTLGGHPAYTLMAATPAPAGLDECLLGSLYRDKPLELVACRSQELEVPVDAELVIEGFIDPTAAQEPVGEIAGPLGYYRRPGVAPVIQVTAITHRVNPILPAIISGPPPHELSVIRAATQRFLLPIVKLIVPELVDMAWPSYGGAQDVLFVSIHKTYAQQARRVASALWGLSWLMTSRYLVVVDEDVDVHDDQQVWRQVAANADPACDVFTRQGPTDGWDHAAPSAYAGNQLGIDATDKLPLERPRGWPQRVVMSGDVRERVGSRLAELGIEPAGPTASGAKRST